MAENQQKIPSSDEGAASKENPEAKRVELKAPMWALAHP